MQDNDVYQSILVKTEIKKLMIPADKVAFVHADNSLEHALLILSRSGYSAIPVLGHDSSIKGVINTSLIMNEIIGIHGYNVDQLSEKKVETVMTTDIPKVKETERFFRALELSINWPFVCVEDANNVFVGILTRKAILALMYQHYRNFRD